MKSPLSVELEEENRLYRFADFLDSEESGCRSVLRHSQLINDKASAVLTHVSLMLAASTVALQKYGSYFAPEIVIYSAACMLPLGSIWMMGPDFVSRDKIDWMKDKDKFIRNVARRRVLLRWAIVSTGATTLGFLLHIAYAAAFLIPRT